MRELTIRESKDLINILKCYPLIGDIEVTLSTAGDLVLPVMPIIRFDNVTKPQAYPVGIRFLYRDVETFVVGYFSHYRIERRRPRILTNGFEIRFSSPSSDESILLKGVVIPPKFKIEGIKK